MNRTAVALAAFGLSACAPAHGPWTAPWPREPVRYEPPPSLKAPAPAPAEPLPIDLPTVLRLAGANSLDVAYIREKVHEAYARSEQADQRFWPTVGPALAFRRHEGLTQDTGGTFVDVDKQQTFAGVRGRLQWEVGEAIYASLSASQRYEGSLSGLEAADLEARRNAAVAYYDLVREQERARIAEQSAAVADVLEAELKAAVAAGRGFEGDVLRARVQQAGARLQFLRAREGIQAAALHLASLLRLAPGVELIAAEETPEPLDLVPEGVDDTRWLAEALDRRPEIEQARAEVRAAVHEKTGAVWGPLVPDLMVEAAPGRLGPVFSDGHATEDYAVLLGWRIGPGGLFDSGRQRLAEAKARQADIEVERVRQRVSDDVQAGFVHVRAKREQMALARSAVEDAAEALRLNRERQAQGVGLPLEVLQAEEALTRARTDLLGAVVEFNQAQVRIFAAAGRRLGDDGK